MKEGQEARLTDLSKAVRRRMVVGLKRVRRKGPAELRFWFLALCIGFAAGIAALFFRTGINGLQAELYGVTSVMSAHEAGRLPWYLVVSLPVAGGLVVGLILYWFTPEGRARGVAEVIEGAALNNGRVEKRAGLASAAASLITLSSGGSGGREGPVVHLAAVISTWLTERIGADRVTGRDLLGCAVAAAVSASFNAPIAGTIFALEVVLRHYAIHAFAPIAIAAVAGTVVTRLEFGNVTEYTLPPESALAFHAELPAFMLLGLICALVAVILMRSVFWAEEAGDRLERATGMPRWLRPVLAGAALGVIALAFPHIIGVGYEVTSRALTGGLGLQEAIVFCAVKVAAVAITLGGRMGGGVFSPALVVGALTGLAFGLIATATFPELSGSETLYALAGMGAVAAAVLGAPISTTLIVFELTGDWQTAIALMVAVSLSSALSSRLVRHSFFLTQLHRRGVELADGSHRWLLRRLPVEEVMRDTDSQEHETMADLYGMIAAGRHVRRGDTLEPAMALFEAGGPPVLPVVRRGAGGAPELVGVLHHIDTLKAYNRALAEQAAEEHA
ncbi:voltage-gated chloride channel [Rhodobacteraceae bacterium WD3A24]|nr:voltage-gated chloride channel [Rhodobacteraceae bacterium WD3A24]